MSKELELTIEWKKHAKQRPRHGANGHSYTPKATKVAEKIIADNFLAATEGLWVPYETYCGMHVGMSDKYLYIHMWEMDPPTSKSLTGDTDNYLKTVGDALNHIAYTDDKLVRSLKGIKE